MSAVSDLIDPMIVYELRRLRPVAQNAYLLALAAFQRGLKVTFHDNYHHVPRFANLPLHGFRGELFSVSDGKTTRYFRRSISDTVSREVSASCENKQATKAILHKAGVSVPPGLIITHGDEPEIKDFVERYKQHQFLLKPYAGSLGEGVVRAIPADKVQEEIAKIAGKPHLLEVFLRGREFRLFVIDDEVVGGHERIPAHVIGDGQSTIEALVAQKNQLRAQHLVYQKYPLEIGEIQQQFLSIQGLSLNAIPESGQRIWLNDIPAFREGGHLQGLSVDGMSSKMKQAAIDAAKAIGISFTGLDMIVLNLGEVDEQVFILELNQCPHLTGVLGGLPMTERPAYNTICESLIDFHFPESRKNKRFPKASFDLASIVALLETGSAAEVTLPVLEPSWVHIRYGMPVKLAEATDLSKLLIQTRAAGLHARIVKSTAGEVIVDALIPETQRKKLDALVGLRG